MILTEEQIKEYIKKPQAGEQIASACLLERDHKLHVLGDGYKSYWLNKSTKGFESNKTRKKKEHYCRPKTPRIYEGINNQYAKIFRAKGHVKAYQFQKNQKDNENALKNYLKDVSFGMSMQQFMQSIWFPSMTQAFNGFIGVELTAQSDLKNPLQDEPYLQFYPIEEVHDVLIRGTRIEYIILCAEIYKGGQKKEAYRVIDDEKDIIYYKEGDEILVNTKDVLVEKEGLTEIQTVVDSYENKFGEVPFIQASNYKASVFQEVLKHSPITRSIPNADSYLSIADDHTICVKQHQHPLFYSYPITCPTCNGAKVIKRQLEELIDGQVQYAEFNCTGCNGNGYASALKTDITDGISLPIAARYEDEGFPSAQSPAGYVTPELESLKEQRVEMQDEQSFIEYACLGVAGILARDTQTQITATKAELDLQPLVDRLSTLSANAEIVEQFLTNQIAKILFGDNFKGCQIHYGRIYFLKSSEQLWADYKTAKEAGATEAQLKEILRAINYIKYENDPMAEQRSQMLLDIEPMPTLSNDELISLQTGIDENLFKLKVNFNDLLNQFEEQYGNIIYYKSEVETMTYLQKTQEIKSILIEYAKQIKPISTGAPVQQTAASN